MRKCGEPRVAHPWSTDSVLIPSRGFAGPKNILFLILSYHRYFSSQVSRELISESWSVVLPERYCSWSCVARRKLIPARARKMLGVESSETRKSRGLQTTNQLISNSVSRSRGQFRYASVRSFPLQEIPKTNGEPQSVWRFDEDENNSYSFSQYSEKFRKLVRSTSVESALQVQLVRVRREEKWLERWKRANGWNKRNTMGRGKSGECQFMQSPGEQWQTQRDFPRKEEEKKRQKWRRNASKKGNRVVAARGGWLA